MDGIEFFKKSCLSRPDVVKILITAYASDSVSCQAMQAGVQKVIPKPFTCRDLLDCLATLTEPAAFPYQKESPTGIP